MANIKIYGHAATLAEHRQVISDAVHKAVVEAFVYPPDKKFQRFIPIEDEDFVHPAERSHHYLIIEVLLFPGRSVETKKLFYRLVLKNLNTAMGLLPEDLEITLIEASRENWLIRGLPGDELKLNYRVEV